MTNSSPDHDKRVCLITGVGPGTGAALVKRFVAEGYHVAMIARSASRLHELTAELPNTYAFPCDVSSVSELGQSIAQIKQELGAPSVVIHNAVSGAFGSFLDISPEMLEQNFRVNTLALLHLAQFTVPDMIAKGHGSLLCTGNTSAYRGKANFASFAPTKAAQRILLESIARDASPKGVHAAYVAIDAVIDVPWTRKAMPDKPDEFFCNPDDIALECYRIAHQPRSAWSFNVEIRPYAENW